MQTLWSAFIANFHAGDNFARRTGLVVQLYGVLPLSESIVVDRIVACCAERNQVVLRIIAGVAAKLFVVDFQVRHRAARLTPPAVAIQNLLPQPLVRRRIQL